MRAERQGVDAEQHFARLAGILSHGGRVRRKPTWRRVCSVREMRRMQKCWRGAECLMVRRVSHVPLLVEACGIVQ